MTWSVLIALASFAALGSSMPAESSSSPTAVDVLGAFECPPSAKPYLVPDPLQCDRYAICRPAVVSGATGKKTIYLCEDGFGLDAAKGKCDLLQKVDCGERTELQEAFTLNPNCPRANGFFAIEGARGEFMECRGGRDFPSVCPAGTVFDSALATCVHPDQTSRVECDASIFHNFTCPEFDASANSLRFGDHDRLPHPTDCSKFFSCLLNGRPRLSSCQPPTVFDPASGTCKRYDQVPSCADFYDGQTFAEDSAVRVVSIDIVRKQNDRDRSLVVQ